MYLINPEADSIFKDLIPDQWVWSDDGAHSANDCGGVWRHDEGVEEGHSSFLKELCVSVSY